jgi:hypothetical protein
MPRKEQPGIGRRLPRLFSAIVLIVIGGALLFRDYSAGIIGSVLDRLRDLEATRSFAVALRPHYRAMFAEPSHGLEWMHIAGMVFIAVGLVLILWRSQRPPERDPG